MAFPVTIGPSGTWGLITKGWGGATRVGLGPFQVGTDFYVYNYFDNRFYTRANDPDGAWTALATVTPGGAIALGVTHNPVANTFHLFTRAVGSSNHFRQLYAPSIDSWNVTETINTGSAPNNADYHTAAMLSEDNSVSFVAYQGPTSRIMGANYDRIYAANDSAGWAINLVSPNDQNNYVDPTIFESHAGLNRCLIRFVGAGLGHSYTYSATDSGTNVQSGASTLSGEYKGSGVLASGYYRNMAPDNIQRIYRSRVLAVGYVGQTVNSHIIGYAHQGKAYQFLRNPATATWYIILTDANGAMQWHSSDDDGATWSAANPIGTGGFTRSEYVIGASIVNYGGSDRIGVFYHSDDEVLVEAQLRYLEIPLAVGPTVAFGGFGA